ncbi:MAG: hypothetical protein WBG48_19800 [Pricia sp.]
MATKTVKRTGIEKVAGSFLGLATKTNDFALNTTEKVFTTSFMVAGKCLDTTSKVVRKGLEISAIQQDLAFDVLKGVKKKIVKK